MAINYFHMDVKSRSQGHSVESVGAYMTGSKMTNALTNETYDHRTKDDVDEVFVLAPSWVPTQLKQPEVLCQEISLRENRKDSQLCRYAIIALPRELSDEKNIELIKVFCEITFVVRGMIVLVAIHGLGTNNPHAHILIAMRSFDIALGGFGLKQREWNSRTLLKSQRKRWEIVCNQFLERAGVSERISCETNESRGITKPKQKHMGSYVHKLWKYGGIIVERSAQYVIDTEPKNLENINKEITVVESEIAALELEDDKLATDVIPQQSQLKPVVHPAVTTPCHSNVYSGPTFDLSKIYGHGLESKLVRQKPKFECNFDEEMKLVPTVLITRIGNPHYLNQHEMTLKERIQQYINNHWDLREILPESMIAELGLQNVLQEITEIRGENQRDMGFWYWDIPDDDFAEDCESNLVVDEEGKRWLRRDYNDPYRDFIPEEDMNFHPEPPPGVGPGMCI